MVCWVKNVIWTRLTHRFCVFQVARTKQTARVSKRSRIGEKTIPMSHDLPREDEENDEEEDDSDEVEYDSEPEAKISPRVWNSPPMNIAYLGGIGCRNWGSLVYSSETGSCSKGGHSKEGQRVKEEVNPLERFSSFHTLSIFFSWCPEGGARSDEGAPKEKVTWLYFFFSCGFLFFCFLVIV